MRQETVPSHASASLPKAAKVVTLIAAVQQTHDVIRLKLGSTPRNPSRPPRQRQSVHGLAHVSLSLSRTRERMYNPNRNQEVALVKAHKQR